MAKNPYLEDNPYLNGFNFDENGNSTDNLSGYSFEENNDFNYNSQNNYINNFENKKSKKSAKEEPVNETRDFDILDPSTFINTDPKTTNAEGEPYKEIKRKKNNKKMIKVKEKSHFNFKSFLLGTLLSLVIFISSLGITIASLYNSLTVGRIQKILNTTISDGEINNYSISDLVTLFQSYDNLTVGTVESLLGFDLNEASDDVVLGDLFEEVSSTYLNKSYKKIKLRDLENSLSTIINNITLVHFAEILSKPNKDETGLKFFSKEIVNKKICETIIDSFKGSDIKLLTFFGEELGLNLNTIKIGTMVKKIFTIDENSSRFEEFIYNAFDESQYGLYDLIKNYTDVVNDAVKVKDIVNSFIDDNTNDALLKIIRESFGNDNSGVASFIDNISESLDKIYLHTIVTNLWPDLNNENLNTTYDGFIRLIYNIYSKTENNVTVKGLINNPSAQLNYIKITDVINAFLTGDSKIEEFIRTVYGNEYFDGVGFGNFVDNFMSTYINEISVKKIIEAFVVDNNKFINYIKSIYATEEYDYVGVSQFIDNFVNYYSKDITVGSIVWYIVAEDELDRTPFDKFLLELWGDEDTALIDALSDFKGFIDEITIKEFATKAYQTEIITENLYNLIHKSIHDEYNNLLPEFTDMGVYTYFSNVTDYINNITLEEILENTQNLPEILVKIIELVGHKGVLDFIENPLDMLAQVTLREVCEIYFSTAKNEDKTYEDTNNNSVPDSFDDILNIVAVEEDWEQDLEQKLLGEITIQEFLDSREAFLDKIQISYILEYLKENGTIVLDDGENGGLSPALYEFLKEQIGGYGVIDFANNASTYLKSIKLETIISTLDNMGALQGLKDSKKEYLITFITEKFGALEINDFANNFTDHLNSVTVEDLLDYINNSTEFERDAEGNYINKTYKVLFGVVDKIIEKIKFNNTANFKLFLEDALAISELKNKELLNTESIAASYGASTLESFEYYSEAHKQFVLQVSESFNERANSSEYGNNELRLNDFIVNLFKNTTNLTIENLCNVFEVKLEPEENETLSVYGKLLNKIKDYSLQEVINDAEFILEDNLKTVISETTIGEVQSTFEIDLLKIFKTYNADTPLQTIFDDFENLTIGHIVGESTSFLLQKLSTIKLSEMAGENGLVNVIENLVLGDFVSINKVHTTINALPTKTALFTDLANYFTDKYVTVTNTSNFETYYYIFNGTTFERTNDISGKFSAFSVNISENNENVILNTIYNMVNVYSTVNFDRYYKYENNVLQQINSSDSAIALAQENGKLVTLNEFTNQTLQNEYVYKLTTNGSDKYKTRYYRYNFITELWELKDIKVTAAKDYFFNAFDLALTQPTDDLLPQDAIKMNDFHMVFDGKLFDLSTNFTADTNILACLKYTKIKEIATKVNNLTVGEVFGENSKIVKLVGNDQYVKISELENKLNISELTVGELGELGLLDTARVKDEHLDKTLQDILDEYLG